MSDHDGGEHRATVDQSVLAAAHDSVSMIASAATPGDTKRPYWAIDSVFVRNGSLRPGADDVTAYLVGALPSATEAGRGPILELLVQLGGGVAPAEFGGHALEASVTTNLLAGVDDYVRIMHTSTGLVRFHCIDVLAICADSSVDARPAILDALHAVAQSGDRERLLVSAIEADLRKQDN
ncbi:MAG: hypothetical protein J2P17_29605 [Mycobacterium sp.]|nr:hypothetical protein [Mycobacterium sp.]